MRTNAGPVGASRPPRSTLSAILCLAVALGGGCESDTGPGGLDAVAAFCEDSSLSVDQTVSCSAIPIDANRNELPGLPAPTWASSAPETANVDAATGLVTGLACASDTGKECAAVVTATIEGKTGRVPVTVTIPVTRVDVAPSPVDVEVGGDAPLTALPKGGNGAALGDRECTWRSNDESVARVDATSGVVTGVAGGETTVVATCEGVAGSATVRVRRPTGSVTVAPSTLSVVSGSAKRPTVTVRDDVGNEVPDAAVAWTSQNPDVVRVEPNGRVVGLQPSESPVRVIAARGAKADTVQVTVTAPPLFVVGRSVTPAGQDRAFLWTEAGGMRDLGTLPGGSVSFALGANENGQVVGYSTNAAGVRRAFVWTDADGMQELPALASNGDSEAYDINNSGQIIGVSRNAAGDERPVIWSGGVLRDLGTLGGGGRGLARAINNGGTIVGWSTDAAGVRRAVLWAGGGTPLSIAPAASSPSEATAINSLGQAAGAMTMVDGQRRAFSWNSVDGMVVIPTLGGDYGFGYGINTRGEVVGMSRNAAGFERAFVWTRGHEPRDIGSLGGSSFAQARAINDRGDIAGVSLLASKNTAFLYTSPSGPMRSLGTLFGTESIAHGLSSPR